MSSKSKTAKKSALKKSPKSPRHSSAKKQVRIDSAKNLIKEYEKDYDLSEIGNLWTTPADETAAKVSIGIVDPRGFRDKFRRNLAENEASERRKKHFNIKKYVKSTIGIHRNRNRLLNDIRSTPQGRIVGEEEPIILVRHQPKLTSNILEQFHNSTARNGGKRKNKRHTMKRGTRR